MSMFRTEQCLACTRTLECGPSMSEHDMFRSAVEQSVDLVLIRSRGGYSMSVGKHNDSPVSILSAYCSWRSILNEGGVKDQF